MDGFRVAYGVCGGEVAYLVVFDVPGLKHGLIGTSSTCKARQEMLLANGETFMVRFDGRRTVTFDLETASDLTFKTTDGNVICVSGPTPQEFQCGQVEVETEAWSPENDDEQNRLVRDDRVQAEIARLRSR